MARQGGHRHARARASRSRYPDLLTSLSFFLILIARSSTHILDLFVHFLERLTANFLCRVLWSGSFSSLLLVHFRHFGRSLLGTTLRFNGHRLRLRLRL